MWLYKTQVSGYGLFTNYSLWYRRKISIKNRCIMNKCIIYWFSMRENFKYSNIHYIPAYIYRTYLPSISFLVLHHIEIVLWWKCWRSQQVSNNTTKGNKIKNTNVCLPFCYYWFNLILWFSFPLFLQSYLAEKKRNFRNFLINTGLDINYHPHILCLWD